MTKKDFELIASVMLHCRPAQDSMGDLQNPVWEKAVLEFAHRLPPTNANFQKGRFLRACGYNG